MHRAQFYLVEINCYLIKIGLSWSNVTITIPYIERKLQCFIAKSNVLTKKKEGNDYIVFFIQSV